MLPSPLLAEMLAESGRHRVANRALPDAPVRPHDERRLTHRIVRRRRRGQDVAGT
jgi:hypothetical protein